METGSRLMEKNREKHVDRSTRRLHWRGLKWQHWLFIKRPNPQALSHPSETLHSQCQSLPNEIWGPLFSHPTVRKEPSFLTEGFLSSWLLEAVEFLKHWRDDYTVWKQQANFVVWLWWRRKAIAVNHVVDLEMNHVNPFNKLENSHAI